MTERNSPPFLDVEVFDTIAQSERPLKRRRSHCTACGNVLGRRQWCVRCNYQKLKDKFQTWTSGNQQIDSIIQATQLEYRGSINYWEWIEPDRFTNIKHIGNGGFGSIYKATWLDGLRSFELENGRTAEVTVALKVLHGAGNVTEDFLKELRVFSAVNRKSEHEFPHVYGITKHTQTDSYAIVMKYFYNDLRKEISEYIDWVWFKSRLSSLCQSLSSLHYRNIVQCDLHPGNVLCAGIYSSIANISNFGLSKVADKTMDSRKGKGSYGVIPYMAPELFKGQSHTKYSDVYALGIIMWELLSGEQAFSDQKHGLKLILDICGGLRPPITKEIPDVLIPLLKKCWDPNPAERPTSENIAFKVKKWIENEEIYYRIAKEDRTFHPTGAVYTSRFIPYIARPWSYDHQTSDANMISDDEWERILAEHERNESINAVQSIQGS